MSSWSPHLQNLPVLTCFSKYHTPISYKGMSQFLVGDMCHTWQPNPEAEVSKLVPPLCSARSSVSDFTLSRLYVLSLLTSPCRLSSCIILSVHVHFLTVYLATTAPHTTHNTHTTLPVSCDVTLRCRFFCT